MKKLKLGYAPTRRFVFSAEDAFRYKVLIREKIESFGMDIDIVDLEGLNQEGLLYDDHINADLIAEKFRQEMWMPCSSPTATSGPKIRSPE